MVSGPFCLSPDTLSDRCVSWTPDLTGRVHVVFLGKTPQFPRVHHQAGVQIDNGKLVRVRDKLLAVTIFAVLFTFEVKYAAVE